MYESCEMRRHSLLLYQKPGLIAVIPVLMFLMKLGTSYWTQLPSRLRLPLSCTTTTINCSNITLTVVLPVSVIVGSVGRAILLVVPNKEIFNSIQAIGVIHLYYCGVDIYIYIYIYR